MMIATVLCVSLLCAGLCCAAQYDSAPVIACNLKAINAADRPHYNDLMKRLRLAVGGRSEVHDGYVFELNGKVIGLLEVAEWISLERLCCPFLTFTLSVSGNQVNYILKLTGPDGVKELLKAEFPGH
jgi:hypothetical protein